MLLESVYLFHGLSISYCIRFLYCLSFCLHFSKTYTFYISKCWKSLHPCFATLTATSGCDCCGIIAAVYRFPADDSQFRCRAFWLKHTVCTAYTTDRLKCRLSAHCGWMSSTVNCHSYLNVVFHIIPTLLRPPAPAFSQFLTSYDDERQKYQLLWSCIQMYV